ncbi:HGGxSTG domain-containing protein [Sphingomonas qomolangmaensis]|uniref:HGGxSTG domain-containing protein n=1 Tax=Sphingomonas qomolangmaensis TaxID=2918765 RepID=UPI0038730742
MQCGAKTRRGNACLLTSIYLNGRCKFHGGMSKGPKTEAGKAAAKANFAKRWASEPHENPAKPDIRPGKCSVSVGGRSEPHERVGNVEVGSPPAPAFRELSMRAREAKGGNS